MKFLQIPSMLGVLAIIYVVIIVPVEYFAKEHPDVHTKTHPDSWTDIFLVLPTMCFCYQAQVNAVPVFVALKTRAECIKATLAANIILVLSYCFVAICGYLTFGKNIDHDILISYPMSPAVLVAIIMVAIKTFAGYPVNLFCGRTAIDSLSVESSIATDTRQTTKRRILIVCLWFFSSLVGAIFLPNISVAIHYLGALAASFIFIFPGLGLYFHVEQSWINSWENIISISIGIFYVAVGVFVTALTILQSLYSDISGKQTSSRKIC
jgi:sodium-coupled neutral amino acid transporter 7/8